MQSVLAYAGVRGNSWSWPETRERLLAGMDLIVAAEDEDEIVLALDGLARTVHELPGARPLTQLIDTDIGYGRIVLELPGPDLDAVRYVGLGEPDELDVSLEGVRSMAHAVRRGVEIAESLRLESGLSDAFTRAGLHGFSEAPPEGQILLLGEGGSAAEDAATGDRYLNAGLFHEGASLPMGADDAPPPGRYELRANVGSFWGPGSADVPFPDDVVAAAFAAQGALACRVALIPAPAVLELGPQELLLPPEGNSAPVIFPVTFQEPQRHSMTVCLFYRGHLLQARRLDVDVREVGMPAPAPPAPPAQHAHTIFTRTAELDSGALEEFARTPRRLAIVVDHDAVERISLHFFETQGEHEEELAQVDTNVSLSSLTELMAQVRRGLEGAMDAYVGRVGGSDDELLAELGPLAELGRRFHLALLPPRATGTEKRAFEDLPAGTIVQVDPLSAQPSVPWEMLYERGIETYRPGRTRLCETFRQHSPSADQCPHKDDDMVVCPHAFWGFRYVVEQLPSRRVRGESARSLPTKVRTAGGLRMGAFVSTKLRRVDEHLRRLETLGKAPAFELKPVLSLQEAEAALKEPGVAQWALLYFYTHAGRRPNGAAFVTVGADEITALDLDAWDVRFPRSPLVVLNACGSADYSPEDFESMILFLCARGAAGVVATQCIVREFLADAMIVPFLGSLFKSVECGRALLDARLALLRVGDPRGLAYSLFASADVVLEEAVAA